MAMVTKTLEELMAQSPSPERLEEIANIKDKNIDFSDIPELTKADFARAIPHAEFLAKRNRAKAQASAFDADLVAWLSVQNQETKQHVNEAVRHIMLAFSH